MKFFFLFAQLLYVLANDDLKHEVNKNIQLIQLLSGLNKEFGRLYTKFILDSFNEKRILNCIKIFASQSLENIEEKNHDFQFYFDSDENKIPDRNLKKLTIEKYNDCEIEFINRSINLINSNIIYFDLLKINVSEFIKYFKEIIEHFVSSLSYDLFVFIQNTCIFRNGNFNLIFKSFEKKIGLEVEKLKIKKKYYLDHCYPSFLVSSLSYVLIENKYLNKNSSIIENFSNYSEFLNFYCSIINEKTHNDIYFNTFVDCLSDSREEIFKILNEIHFLISENILNAQVMNHHKNLHFRVINVYLKLPILKEKMENINYKNFKNVEIFIKVKTKKIISKIENLASIISKIQICNNIEEYKILKTEILWESYKIFLTINFLIFRIHESLLNNDFSINLKISSSKNENKYVLENDLNVYYAQMILLLQNLDKYFIENMRQIQKSYHVLINYEFFLEKLLENIINCLSDIYHYLELEPINLEDESFYLPGNLIQYGNMLTLAENLLNIINMIQNKSKSIDISILSFFIFKLKELILLVTSEDFLEKFYLFRKSYAGLLEEKKEESRKYKIETHIYKENKTKYENESFFNRKKINNKKTNQDDSENIKNIYKQDNFSINLNDTTNYMISQSDLAHKLNNKTTTNDILKETNKNLCINTDELQIIRDNDEKSKEFKENMFYEFLIKKIFLTSRNINWFESESTKKEKILFDHEINHNDEGVIDNSNICDKKTNAENILEGKGNNSITHIDKNKPCLYHLQNYTNDLNHKTSNFSSQTAIPDICILPEQILKSNCNYYKKLKIKKYFSNVFGIKVTYCKNLKRNTHKKFIWNTIKISEIQKIIFVKNINTNMIYKKGRNKGTKFFLAENFLVYAGSKKETLKIKNSLNMFKNLYNSNKHVKQKKILNKKNKIFMQKEFNIIGYGHTNNAIPRSNIKKNRDFKQQKYNDKSMVRLKSLKQYISTIKKNFRNRSLHCNSYIKKTENSTQENENIITNKEMHNFISKTIDIEKNYQVLEETTGIHHQGNLNHNNVDRDINLRSEILLLNIQLKKEGKNEFNHNDNKNIDFMVQSKDKMYEDMMLNKNLKIENLHGDTKKIDDNVAFRKNIDSKNIVQNKNSLHRDCNLIKTLNIKNLPYDTKKLHEKSNLNGDFYNKERLTINPNLYITYDSNIKDPNYEEIEPIIKIEISEKDDKYEKKDNPLDIKISEINKNNTNDILINKDEELEKNDDTLIDLDERVHISSTFSSSEKNTESTKKELDSNILKNEISDELDFEKISESNDELSSNTNKNKKINSNFVFVFLTVGLISYIVALGIKKWMR